jgi:hypothetical protein
MSLVPIFKVELIRFRPYVYVEAPYRSDAITVAMELPESEFIDPKDFVINSEEYVAKLVTNFVDPEIAPHMIHNFR